MWRVVGAGLLSAALFLRLAARGGRAHPRADLEGVASLLVVESDAALCGIVEDNQRYVGIPELGSEANVTGIQECCSICQGNPQCRAWIFDLSTRCTLMRMSPGQVPTRLESQGVVSGLPFRAPVANSQSMFCWTLIVPHSYELELVSLQHRLRQSMFGCDEYQVYSNSSFLVAEGVSTAVVDMDLHCENGGEFKTALNTGIFLSVWRKVVSDGRFLFHDWIVKVDADTVFFPSRLRIALAFHHPPEGGLYLNNCKYGLHGPIEVLSRQAVLRWVEGAPECIAHFNTVCSGDCYWGEDMFLDQCLSKVLNVSREDDWNILSEDHCDYHHWMDCKSSSVAFHPFKTSQAYEGCLRSARLGALPL